MQYCSTRKGPGDNYSAAEAMMLGPAPDGGLFVPLEIPAFRGKLASLLAEDSYTARAALIMKPYLKGFTPGEVEDCAVNAYSLEKGRFSHPRIAPLHKLDDNLYVLELWHGPTCAFKDLALQILPHLLRRAAQKTGDKGELVILTATSGDTGKAALEGFRDVPGTRVIVFYPAEGISEMQRRQMVTQEGNNVHVAAVRGNFDDAQAGVKAIFADRTLAANLAEKGYRFTSANSINWGRLAPQIAYYWSAYTDLLENNAVKPGNKVNFVVPTGNFGNILAGYYALRMGLPVGRLICASNENHVITDFIRKGVYDRNRPFHRTISPSMDILISSNLERLLYHLSGEDAGKIRAWMQQLQEQGYYSIDRGMMESLSQLFWSGWTGEDGTKAALESAYRNYGYLMDPHTAVGKAVYRQYVDETGDPAVTVLLSTASPFKFNRSVTEALLEPSAPAGASEFELLETLSRATGWQVPGPLANLGDKKNLHRSIFSREEMKDGILSFLNS